MRDRQRAYNTRARFEQWAKNPLCEANTISAVHGYTMDKVSVKEGGSTSRGQSGFAMSRGKLFEKSLLKNQAERLVRELRAKGLVGESEPVEYRDFRQTIDGGPFRGIDESLNATRDCLRQIATGKPKLYLLVGPVAVVPGSNRVILPEAMLVIDVLLVRPTSDGFEAIVGEVKTYPDRGGYTDPSSLSTARSQAGIYVHGLRLVIEDLKLDRPIRVSSRGFLVLSKAGSNEPSVRANEDLRFMAERAATGFEKLRQVADSLEKIGEDGAFDAIRAAKINYREDCFTFCDRAPRCLAIAKSAGLPIVLGHEMERFLGDVSLHRAIELIEGAKPMGENEAQLLQQLKLLKAVG